MTNPPSVSRDSEGWPVLAPVFPMLADGPIRIAVRGELPKEYTQGIDAWNAAMRHHGAARFAQAAEEFLRCALLLASKQGDAFHREYTENRGLAYQNAAISFAQAGKVKQGLEAIKKLEKADPACKDNLAEALEVLTTYAE